MTSDPRQKFSVMFVLSASICHHHHPPPPVFFLDFGTCVNNLLPPPSYSEVQLLPLPFRFYCWVRLGLGAGGGCPGQSGGLT